MMSSMLDIVTSGDIEAALECILLRIGRVFFTRDVILVVYRKPSKLARFRTEKKIIGYFISSFKVVSWAYTVLEYKLFYNKFFSYFFIFASISIFKDSFSSLLDFITRYCG